MIFLRAILYVICLISLIWSVLFFVGPSVARWSINTLSDDQIAAYNITITPKLDIKIGRLEYKLTSQTTNSVIQGVSRSNEISWSLFDSQSLIKVELGPTVFGDLFEVNQVTITTKPFFEFDYENILIDTDAKEFDAASFGGAAQLNIKGVFKYRVSTFEDVAFELKSVKANKLGLWSVGSATGMLNKIKLNTNINEQPLSLDFFIKDLNADYSKLTADRLSGRLTKLNDDVDFEVNVEGTGLKDQINFQKVTAYGQLSNGQFLNSAVDFKDGDFSDGISKIPSISADISGLKIIL